MVGGKTPKCSVMAKATVGVTPRGRLDHRLPQSFLDGFLGQDATQLWIYDRERKRWFEAISGQVAAERGFYDYSLGSVPDQTADDAFQELESKFPTVRTELILTNSSGWETHREFLFTYAQMLRARTELFRQQVLEEARTQPMLRIAEVLPPDPVTGHTRLRYEELTETDEDREVLYRNRSITTMRAEIAQGAAHFRKLHWCLRLAPDPADPVITSDCPVIAQGRASAETMFDDPNTLVFFPLCRQACLVGSPARFQRETDTFHSTDLQLMRSLFLEADCRFAYAPVRLSV